jgi:hypothetical protein
MSGKSQRSDYQSEDYGMCLPTNDVDASSWGNGFLANSMHTSGMAGPDGTGSFGESMFDMSRQLSSSGVGTGNWWSAQAGDQTSHNWDDFYSGGMGLGYGGSMSGEHGHYSGGGGVGAGGGGGSWSRETRDADGNVTRSAEGYGGGLGVNARGEQSASLFGQSAHASGEAYRGIGGNAYSFEEDGRSGYGVDANYTPLGFNNVEAGYDTALGSGDISAENMVFGRMNGSLEGYQTDDGGYGLQGSFSPGRTEIHNVEANSSTFMGDTHASLGSYGTGPRWTGGMEAHEDGSVYGNLGWAGGGYKFSEGHATHDFGNGMEARAGFETIDTADSWNVDGGYNAQTGNLEGSGNYSTGNTVKNAYFDTDVPGGGSFGAELGEYSDGNNVTVDEFSMGRDGLHTSGSGHWGGAQVNNVAAHGGWEGVYYNEASADEISNRSYIDGASLDVDGDGVRAHMDEMRTGGFRAYGLEGRSDFMGTRTDASVGEISNDFLLQGADFSAGPDGVHAGFDNLDFGGIRVKDAALHSDLGPLGEVDASVGSFTNGNSFSGGAFDIDGDGVHASLDSFGVMGMDAEDVNFSADGPLGMYSEAHLGRLHTGLAGEGAYANIGPDGIDLGAESLSYDQYLLEDVQLAGGIEGVMESEFSLGEGHLNSGSAENLHVGLDGDGLGISADNAQYSYLGVEDAHISQELFGGAMGQSVDIGRGDYLGASAGHIEYQTNLMNTSFAVEDLNAHGLQLEDTHIRQNVGDLNTHVGADELNILDLNVGAAEFESENFYTSGSGSIDDAQLDLIQAEGLGADIGWGDTTLLGAQTDLNASVGVDHAEADWDMFAGTGHAEFENANANLMTDNTHLEMFGMGLDVGRTGVNLNASGGADMDLSEGAASGNVNLAGTELALFGSSVELGDWAQASAGVNVSEGAADFNLGGDNGIGADMNLSEGNLDLNLFGMEIDVDEGLSDAADWVGGAASDVGGAVASFFSGW